MLKSDIYISKGGLFATKRVEYTSKDVVRDAIVLTARMKSKFLKEFIRTTLLNSNKPLSPEQILEAASKSELHVTTTQLYNSLKALKKNNTITQLESNYKKGSLYILTVKKIEA